MSVGVVFAPAPIEVVPAEFPSCEQRGFREGWEGFQWSLAAISGVC